MLRKCIQLVREVKASRRTEPYDTPVETEFVEALGFRVRITDSKSALYTPAPAPSVEASNSIVFIHGLFGCLETWIPVQQELSQQHILRVVTINLGEDSSLQPLNWTAQASVVAKILDVLDVSNTFIVGHGSGAMVAARAAIFSERVRGVVFLAPIIHRYWTLALLPWLVSSKMRFTHASISDRMRKHHKNPGTLAPEVAAAHNAAACSIPFLAAILSTVAKKDSPFIQVLSNIKVPMHIVWADRDTFQHSCEKELDGIVSSSETIADSDHWIQHEQPKVLTGILLKFIGSVMHT